MKTTEKDIQDLFKHLQSRCLELAKLTLKTSDPRNGKRLALVLINEEGCLSVKTDFMEYKEMYAFLCGYLFKVEKNFEL